MTIKVPPRCEIIKYVKIGQDYECIVVPEEIGHGVFVAGAIAQPTMSKLIPVRILNVQEKEVTIKNFKPKIANADDYDIVSFANESVKSVGRVEKVLESIKMEHLNDEERRSLEHICAKYADVFHLTNDPLTVTNIYKYNLQLEDNATPAYIKPYRLPQTQKAEIQKEIDKMLKDGIIEPSKSAWSAPLLIVPKKPDNHGNRRMRVILDFRALNARLKSDRFPLPNITEILDSLAGAIYFSHLDLSQGYYQIELEQSSRPYTAFTTNNGQY